jgi:nucleoside 2-deoxyribosyltransferase
MAGRIVLSIGAATGTDDAHFGNLSKEEYDRIKEMLDQLHLRKIDLANEVLVLNVGGYIGDSTAREAGYAYHLGKPVRWLESTLLVDSRNKLEDAKRAWAQNTKVSDDAKP